MKLAYTIGMPFGISAPTISFLVDQCQALFAIQPMISHVVSDRKKLRYILRFDVDSPIVTNLDFWLRGFVTACRGEIDHLASEMEQIEKP